ncbi:21389_t:CDS:2, partial [Gigaspora rosea]
VLCSDGKTPSHPLRRALSKRTLLRPVERSNFAVKQVKSVVQLDYLSDETRTSDYHRWKAPHIVVLIQPSASGIWPSVVDEIGRFLLPHQILVHDQKDGDLPYRRSYPNNLRLLKLDRPHDKYSVTCLCPTDNLLL